MKEIMIIWIGAAKSRAYFFAMNDLCEADDALALLPRISPLRGLGLQSSQTQRNILEAGEGAEKKEDN